MGFEQSFRLALSRLGDQKQQDIAKKTKMAQSTLSLLINDPKRDARLSSIAKIIDSFDKETFLSFIRELRPDLSLDVVNLEGKHEVLTYNIGDINVVLAATEHKTRDSLIHVLCKIEPVFKLQIPEKYFPSDFAIRIIGHSMEPDIPDRSAVGLTTLKADRDFVAGETYLCRLPYEGLVLRRVCVAPGQDALEFQALHTDRDAYRSQIMHPDEALPLIYARVRWVAFRK